MTYQDDNDIYKDQAWRNRAEMCIREQAFIFTNDPQADVAALANACIASNWVDIESIMAAVVTTEFRDATVTDDQVLMETVRAVWSIVAKARYPQLHGVEASVFYGNSPQVRQMRAPTITPLT